MHNGKGLRDFSRRLGPAYGGNSSTFSVPPMMTLADFQDRVVQNIRTTKLTLRKTTGKGSTKRLLDPSNLAPILSTVRQTIIWQLTQREGITHADAVQRLQEGADITPYLSTLEADAHARAAGADGSAHRRPGNAAYLARLGLRLACPSRFGQVWSKGGDAAIPDEWRPVTRAVEVIYTDSPATTRRSQNTVMRAFVRAAVVCGWTPTTVPEDRETALAGLTRAAMGKPSYMQLGINVYNRAAKFLAKADGVILPLIHQRVDTRIAGLRSLPSEAFSSLALHESHLRNDDLLAALAPTINESLDWYRVSGPGAAEKPSIVNARRVQVGRLVATLWGERNRLANARSSINVTVPHTLEECELWDIYTLDVPAAVKSASASRGTAGAGDALAGRFAARATQAGIVAGESWRPLIRDLLDLIARATHEAREVGQPQSALPYPVSTIAVLDGATRIVRERLKAAGSEFEGSNPAAAELALVTLARVEAVHRDIKTRMEIANDRAVKAGTANESEKRKDKLVEVLTLPQLMCIALPRLSEEVRARKREYQQTIALVTDRGHSSPENHPASIGARRAWDNALEDYLALAVFTAHPMRLANLAYGRIGTTKKAEFTVDAEFDEDGRVKRIIRVNGRFAAKLEQTSNLMAALKQTRKRHNWDWWPAIVDFDHLCDYLNGLRRQRILARSLDWAPMGIDVTRVAYTVERDLAAGRLALFISPDNVRSRDPMRYHGGYAGYSVLSNRVGRTMFHVVTRILGHRVTDADGRDLTFKELSRTDWKGLFTGHNVRLFWSTYWHGLRSDREHAVIGNDGVRWTGTQVAMLATSDDERTLRNEYTSVDEATRRYAFEPVDSWMHPHAFDRWMDRAFRREGIDWTTEVLPLPPHLTPLASRNVQEPDRPRVRVRRPRAEAGLG
jgi:hypothetical protein